MNDRPSPDLDAAMVLGMASTAIPFASSREAEAERWLRILRLHGEAGSALQSLGVSEAPLEAHEEQHGTPGTREDQQQLLSSVGALAARAAGRRDSACFGTADVLFAVMEVYGEDFEQVLLAHGTDGAEVLERLALKAA